MFRVIMKIRIDFSFSSEVKPHLWLKMVQSSHKKCPFQTLVSRKCEIWGNFYICKNSASVRDTWLIQKCWFYSFSTLYPVRILTTAGLKALNAYFSISQITGCRYLENRKLSFQVSIVCFLVVSQILSITFMVSCPSYVKPLLRFTKYDCFS